MDRRRFIGLLTVGSFSASGCLGNERSEEASEETTVEPTPTPEPTPSAAEAVELVDREFGFSRSFGDLKLDVMVQNVSDIGRIDVTLTCALYNDNNDLRVTTSDGNIDSLPDGIRASTTIEFDIETSQVRELTRYVLKISYTPTGSYDDIFYRREYDFPQLDIPETESP